MTGHAAASGQKSPPWSAERRQRARSQGCAPRLKSADRLGLAPSRRSTPLIVGTEKENEGRPGARLYREAKRWLFKPRFARAGANASPSTNTRRGINALVNANAREGHPAALEEASRVRPRSRGPPIRGPLRSRCCARGKW